MKIIQLLCFAFLFISVVTNIADARDTWAMQQTGVNTPLNDLFFVNANTGWAVGDEGIILHTTDGGASWSVQYNDENEDLELIRVHFIDDQTGFAVGGEFFGRTGVILRTTDAGQNWETITGEDWEQLYAVSFRDSQHGIAVGGYVFESFAVVTSDGGATWTEPDFDSDSQLLDVVYVDEQNGWITNNSGRIFRTTDGGANWSGTVVENNESFVALSMLDNQRGWTITMNGEVYRTTDGDGWEKISEEIDFLSESVLFVNENDGFAATFNGVFESTDGGVSWAQTLEIGFQTVKGIHQAPDGKIWAAGTGGRIYVRDGEPVSTEPVPDMPARANLHQNYPNPFNPTTMLSFTLPEPADVRLSVYDINGRMIQSVASGLHGAGTHRYSFDARWLSSGLYIYRLQTPEAQKTGRMMLIK